MDKYRLPNGTETTEEALCTIFSLYREFSDYSIEEDNEGQLVVYTGWYRIGEDGKTTPEREEANLDEALEHIRRPTQYGELE